MPFETLINAINYIKSKDINDIVSFEGDQPSKKKKIFEILKISPESLKEKKGLLFSELNIEAKKGAILLEKERPSCITLPKFEEIKMLLSSSEFQTEDPKSKNYFPAGYYNFDFHSRFK